MDSFDAVDASALRWLRTSENPVVFELRSGDRLLARLTRARHEGTLTHAETSAGRWSLKRVGFLHPRVTMRHADSSAPVARLDIHWRRTVLVVDGKAPYIFERAGLSVPAWRFLSAAGAQLVHIEPVREGRQLVGGTVSVSEGGTKLPELPLLLLVGWYFIMHEWYEDEAIAAGEAILEVSARP
ncbi:MAG: hypothetical protein L3K19_05245 [Thermoplasmata archaeon]|nr:hypothetical protein [Thermoplasmata archaeon]